MVKVVPESQKTQTGELLKRCLSGETIRDIECMRLDKDGKASPVLLTPTLLTDDEGKPDSIAISAKQI